MALKKGWAPGAQMSRIKGYQRDRARPLDLRFLILFCPVITLRIGFESYRRHQSLSVSDTITPARATYSDVSDIVTSAM